MGMRGTKDRPRRMYGKVLFSVVAPQHGSRPQTSLTALQAKEQVGWGNRRKKWEKGEAGGGGGDEFVSISN